MAGHSHSANVKYRKDRVNAVKAKAFSKMARMITVAAKLGGGEPDANPRLRLAIDKARSVSMPKDNIERAIKKGTGDASLGNFEDVLYEGYAPHGVAVMLEILTDKRSRTAPEIRKIFELSGGNLGNSGSVAWMFERVASLRIAASTADEERVFEAALEAGADDVQADSADGIEGGAEGLAFQLRCEPSELESVRAAMVAAGFEILGAEVNFLPTNVVGIDDVADARRVVRCLDALEEHDEVQNVYANFEFSDEVLSGLAEGER